jgi:hypothetical protein
VIANETGAQVARFDKADGSDCLLDEQDLAACFVVVDGSRLLQSYAVGEEQPTSVEAGLYAMQGTWRGNILGIGPDGAMAVDRRGTVLTDRLPGRLVSAAGQYALLVDAQNQKLAVYRSSSGQEATQP